MKKNVVIFGGGSGLSNLMKSLKNLDVNLCVVVTISDDGGSTGKIRDYYDIPAPGDLRRVILSLSDKPELEQLMNYRFDNKLQKHTVGNLILTALTQINGNMSSAVKQYCKMLEVNHEVLPLSNESLKLVAKMKSNKLVYGESRIASHEDPIASVSYHGEQNANPEVIEKINNADYIILSCGSLYTSLIANLTLNQVRTSINNSGAKVIYVSNLVTQQGESDNYNLQNHVNAINNHLKENRVDLVIANNNMNVDNDVYLKYEKEDAHFVKFENENKNFDLILDNLVLIDENNHIRHDFKKLYDILKNIVE